MEFHRHDLSDHQLLNLYRPMLTSRLVEEKMLKLLRQGRISKWFSGIGQEAIAAGAVRAMKPEEYILPMIRNLGVFVGRDIPLERLFSQWQGKAEGFTHGRDRSFHFGTNQYRIVGMISHLGPQTGVACGIGLAEKIAHTEKATLVFSGEGGTSEGDFHEALNVAAVWELPVIFLVENNGYALSTPTGEQFRIENLSERAAGYGMEGRSIDGNNILEVYHTLNELAEDIRQKPRPVLVEAKTFRMRGHEEASGTKYVPQELFDEWGEKDPLLRFEEFLLQEGVFDEDGRRLIRAEIQEEINQKVNYAFAQPDVVSTPDKELEDVYCRVVPRVDVPDASHTRKTMRYIDALHQGLWQAMEWNPNLILMGQDIAEYGGVFKVTQGFLEKFGKERVRNTPLCELAIIGAGLGLSVRKFKAMVELQFADFVTSGFNQVVNNLAKSYYRWGQVADVVLRMPTGGAVGAGPYHSQSTEAWFCHTPGLKVVYPATAEDAKGLLTAAFDDPNPILFFEHKALYRKEKGPVPQEYYELPIGKARTIREGNDLSVITYGLAVHWVVEYLEAHPEADVEVLDLRSLRPWDQEAVAASVQKTNKALVCHEAPLTGGFGAEVAAWIGQHCFQYLDAPVLREGALDTPVPFAAPLEAQFLPSERIGKQIDFLLNF